MLLARDRSDHRVARPIQIRGTRLAVLGVAALVLQGCASFEPTIPVGYTGPTASISDHGFNESTSKGQIFYVESIDGKPVQTGSMLTQQASNGQGFGLTLAYAQHPIPARPLRVKIVGTHITGAPIQAIASQIAGTFYKVEGEVNLNPVEGHRYFVMGKLAKDASKVWILDPEVGSVPVTEVVESRPK